MHVNRFIPFYMQFNSLSPQDLFELAKDYQVKENSLIKRQLVDFDSKLIEIFN